MSSLLHRCGEKEIEFPEGQPFLNVWVTFLLRRRLSLESMVVILMENRDYLFRMHNMVAIRNARWRMDPCVIDDRSVTSLYRI